MSNVGYLYVLANSAMPGLVKIGKTTRNPSDRASELSGVTGLPTPFIVVYEQLFQDCSEAEIFVHAYLEQKGFRVSENREFFNAPVNNVIRAIAQAPGAITNDTPQLECVIANELLENNQTDELDFLLLSSPPKHTYPWSSIFDEAENYYYGHGDYIQDYTEALVLFNQAAKLGCLPAFGYIGGMYEQGEGVRQDIEKALELYKAGAKKGSVYCYFAMGMLFSNEENFYNSKKCFTLFINNMRDTLPDGQLLTDNELHKIFVGCFIIIHKKLSLDVKEFSVSVLDTFVAKYQSRILEVAQNLYKMTIDRKSSLADDYRKVIRYLEEGGGVVPIDGSNIMLPEDLYQEAVDLITEGKTLLAASHIAKKLNGIGLPEARELADAICTDLQRRGLRG